MSIFDGRDLPLPPSPFSSKQRAYKRRAYGSVKAVGNDQFTGCQKSYTLTFGGHTTKEWAQGGTMQPRSGGRYVPNPYLTGITTKNQGSGDIADTALWEIEFQYTCYSTSQLNELSDAFMIPGNLIDVTIGYNPGTKLTVSKARVYDFSFSYNSDDGSYSCTTKCLGENSAAGIAGALKVKPSADGSEVKDGDGTATGYSIIKKLQSQAYKALNVYEDSDGDLSGAKTMADGTAKSVGNYGLIKGEKEAGFWAMLFSAGGADNVFATVIKVKAVVEFFNNIVGDKYVLEATVPNLGPEFKSASPLEVCFGGSRGKYGTDNDFSGLDAGNVTAKGGVGDIWISIEKLLDIEMKLMEASKKENQEYTVSQFLNAMFKEINGCTGGAVDCFISEKGGKFYIVNRKADIKKKATGTSIKLLSSTSPVKSLSMSSNLDPDMAAIAFAGGSGRFPTGVIENVFGGCTPKQDVGEKLPTPGEKLKEKWEELNDGYDPQVTQDAKTILKEYVNQKITGISMRYGIDLSVTLDGWSSPRFMDRFTVSPLPSGVGSGDVYFAVGEIEHKCDGETWDTTIVGYMMVNT